MVPCIRRSGFLETTEWILNRSDDAEEQTNPDGFTEWFLQRNTYVGSNQLIKIVRILKYLRDVKLTFSAKSILITTLVGERISWLDEFGDEFSDVPSSLRTVIKRLNAYLQERPDMPEIANPSLSSNRSPGTGTRISTPTFARASIAMPSGLKMPILRRIAMKASSSGAGCLVTILPNQLLLPRQ